MTVYVDDMRAKFGRMIMCHMVADTTEELYAMADRIGIARRHVQYPGTYKEHFDIAQTKRFRAVQCGAKEITTRELGFWLIKRRKDAAAKRDRVTEQLPEQGRR